MDDAEKKEQAIRDGIEFAELQTYLMANHMDQRPRYKDKGLARWALDALRSRRISQGAITPADTARVAIELLRETVHKSPDYGWISRRDMLLNEIEGIKETLK